MNVFQQFYAYLRIREAVRVADKAHKKTGRRYYVLPGENGTVVVTDRKNFRGLRSKHYITGAMDVNMRDVARKCFYHTGYPDGTGYIASSVRREKMRQYYEWYEKSRREHRASVRAKRSARKERNRKIKEAKRDTRNR